MLILKRLLFMILIPIVGPLGIIEGFFRLILALFQWILYGKTLAADTIYIFDLFTKYFPEVFENNEL